jgi:hypothetical protein
VGVLCWLLRGLNLSSSLYTFKECIPCLARDCHFTGSPELTHSLLKHFCLRGTGFLVLPCVYLFHHRGKYCLTILKNYVNCLTYAIIVWSFACVVKLFFSNNSTFDHIF